jgi:hypothetical protein
MTPNVVRCIGRRVVGFRPGVALESPWSRHGVAMGRHGVGMVTGSRTEVADILAGMHACPRHPFRLGAIAVLGLTVLAACSDSAATGGEGLIEGDLAEEIGLGDLDAECAEPAEKVEGETFECTATTDDGQTLTFQGTMTAEDEIHVVTTNLLLPDEVDTIRDEGARVLSDETGVDIAVDDIDCGDEAVLIDDVGDFTCAITDTSTGDVYDLTVSTGGIEPGVGIRELFFQVADEPR